MFNLLLHSLLFKANDTNTTNALHIIPSLMVFSPFFYFFFFLLYSTSFPYLPIPVSNLAAIFTIGSNVPPCRGSAKTHIYKAHLAHQLQHQISAKYLKNDRILEMGVPCHRQSRMQ